MRIFLCFPPNNQRGRPASLASVRAELHLLRTGQLDLGSAAATARALAASLPRPANSGFLDCLVFIMKKGSASVPRQFNRWQQQRTSPRSSFKTPRLPANAHIQVIRLIRHDKTWQTRNIGSAADDNVSSKEQALECYHSTS